MKSFKYLVALATVGFSMVGSPPILALDAASSQAYCNAVKQAATDAQTRYINTYTPQQDPGTTFNNATNSCMTAIGAITIPVPPSIGAMDGVIAAVGKELSNRACAAAQQEFQSAVNRAQQSVNAASGNALNVGVSNGNVTTSSTAYGGVLNSITH